MKKKLLILLLFLILYHSEMITAQSSEPFKLTMQQMFELAETNSKSIRLFDIAEKEAQQAVKVAKNASLPSIDIALSTSYLGNVWLTDRNFSNGQSASIPHFGNNFAIEASQVIYAGGAISHNIAKAELASQLAQYEKEKNRQEIRFFLVGHYLELYKLCNQTGVYLQNIEQTKRLLFNIKARQNEGLALKNDITRYELQLKLLELQLTQIENSKIILNNQLATVLGFPPHTRIEIDTSILNPLPLPLSETDWQETATISSPLLKQAKLVIEQSKHDEKIVAAERLPSIVLFAADHLDGPILIEIPPVNQNFNYWYAGVSLKYNMGSFYKTGRNIKLARLSTQKACESRQLTADHVQMEVTAAYVRFIEAFTIYETQIKSLELATQNYTVINHLYLNDLALITDMLDADNSKLTAELQVASARINIFFHYYKLKKITGNL